VKAKKAKNSFSKKRRIKFKDRKKGEQKNEKIKHKK